MSQLKRRRKYSLIFYPLAALVLCASILWHVPVPKSSTGSAALLLIGAAFILFIAFRGRGPVKLVAAGLVLTLGPDLARGRMWEDTAIGVVLCNVSNLVGFFLLSVAVLVWVRSQFREDVP